MPTITSLISMHMTRTTQFLHGLLAAPALPARTAAAALPAADGGGKGRCFESKHVVIRLEAHAGSTRTTRWFDSNHTIAAVRTVLLLAPTLEGWLLMAEMAHQSGQKEERIQALQQAFALAQDAGDEAQVSEIGRILNGDPDYADSWHDIIGYTRLVEVRLNGGKA